MKDGLCDRGSPIPSPHEQVRESYATVGIDTENSPQNPRLL